MSYLDRLRPASFIDPDGIEYFFLADSLERTTSKKGSIQEILDSDESIPQDQGRKAWRYPINAYFTSADYDLAVDPFVAGLIKRYTQDVPGLLKHPRWGDINVFPLEIAQSEELVNGSMVGRVTVVFGEVFPKIFPSSDGKSLDEALVNIDRMESESEELSENLEVETVQAESNLGGKLGDAAGLVRNNLEGAEELMDTIQSTIDGLLDDVAGNIIEIISATQRLIRAPGRILDSTLNKINNYRDMVNDLVNSFNDENETSPINKRNNALTMELIGGFAVAATAEAAAFTDFSIRSEALDAIDILNETLEIYNDGLESARTDGNVQEEYSGDHNFFSLLLDTVARINELLLNSAFDLKAEKKFTLKSNSDAVTLCYQYYGTVDDETMRFFILTNRFTDDEYLEIPTGREIVIYA